MEKEVVKTNVVAGVVIKQEGKYLLVQEKQPKAYGLWNLPAGRVDVGDTIEQTAIKEAKEESGYDVELVRKIGIFQNDATEAVKHAFEAKIIGGELKFPEDELLDAKWFTIEEIENMKDELRGRWILEAINVTEKEFPRGVEIVGGALMENQEGKIFMAKAPKWANKWTFPGGHIEPGEGIVEALVREAKEEAGIENIQPIGVVSFGELINSKDFHRPAHFIYFDVYCKVNSSEIKLDNYELTEYGWFTPEEALKLDLAESFDKSINDYLKYKNIIK